MRGATSSRERRADATAPVPGTIVMPQIEYEVVDDPGESLTAAICAELREYNVAHNGDFFAARELPQHAARPLNVVARDASGAFIGGVLGETQFAWLKVQILSVIPTARGRGIGRRLMKLAETEASRRGCKYCF